MADVTLFLMSDDNPDLGLLDMPIDEVAISYERVTPGHTRVVVRLFSWQVQDIEEFFGEEARLQVSMGDDEVWHEATLGPHDIRWWAGYK